MIGICVLGILQGIISLCRYIDTFGKVVCIKQALFTWKGRCNLMKKKKTLKCIMQKCGQLYRLNNMKDLLE